MELKRRTALASTSLPPAPPYSRLEQTAQVAQTVLAIVAIFGYFYTVRPIYQKDRLSEQVAEYEGFIKEHKPKVVALEKQLASLSGERNRLNAELMNIKQRLSEAKIEKDKIYRQIQFMNFRYHLPNGRPATTPEQVQMAQDFELSTSFNNGMSLYCSKPSDGETAFIPNVLLLKIGRDDEGIKKTGAFPFTQEELNIWAEQGVRYPLTKAISCARGYSDNLKAKYINDPRSSKLIETFKNKALQAIKVAGSNPWVPPFEPTEITKELLSKELALQHDLERDYLNIEKDKVKWASIEGAEISNAKHNYEVSRQNIEINFKMLQLSLESEYLEKADRFRESINDEITRLINTVKKTESH